MYILKYSSSFKSSYKKLKSNKSFKLDIFKDITSKLLNKKSLDLKHKDHKLTGSLGYARECHISPDILLIYQYKDEELILLLIDIGSHSDLF